MKETFPGVCEDEEEVVVSDKQISETRRKYHDLRAKAQRRAASATKSTAAAAEQPVSPKPA
jgi:hypothetical protein